MKALFGLFALIAVAALGAEEGAAPSKAVAQLSPAASTPRPTEPSKERKEALDALTQTFQSGRSIADAAAAARKAGVPLQTIEELELLSSIRSRDFKTLAPLLKDLEEKILPNWRQEDAVAFTGKSELEAVMLFAKALLAKDARVFEESIKQAFWLNPDLAGVLVEELKARRATERLSALALPMETQFEKSEGGTTSLGELAQGQKALLLDFWATWCGPCIRALPELVKKARDLAPQKVAVVGINTEASRAGGLAVAKRKSEELKKREKVSFAWLVEPTEQPLSKLLKIDSIPRAILVSPEGRVLYDGHPEDSRLAAALQKIGVSLRE